jgi:phosphopantothenoylcysteine decarboxylase/phosphopantothenate--cysteine ligase
LSYTNAMVARDELLSQIEVFLKATGMSASRLGKEAAGDPRFVFDLRSKGREPGARLMERVTAFVAARQPASGGQSGAGVGDRRVLMIIGGGIAAYKSLDLMRRLRERGAAVRAVMTDAAQEFLTPLSVGAIAGGRVFTGLFDRDAEFDVGHIRLARDTDAIVVAPATADLLARMAGGHADDLATAVLLATVAPVMVAPAMNPTMWAHRATQRNVATLRADGIRFAGPKFGEMAEAGEAGIGRMAEPAEIAVAVEAMLAARSAMLAGRHVIVTSGPTHEPIDPVRYLANHSSGRQGHAIAEAAAAAGARVTLVSGPVAIPDPPVSRVVRVETAREMLAAVTAALPADVLVMAAAVADWRVAVPSTRKIKKVRGAPPVIELAHNPDVLATIAEDRKRRPQLVIGFAAETDDLLANAQAKLTAKRADWIVANDVSPEGGVMGGDDNTVHLIDASGIQSWPRLPKSEVAKRLVGRIAEALAGWHGPPPRSS